MEYTIGEFAKVSGIGIYTLRYYEKEQLILPQRQDNGRRCYTERDIEWITFIKRLKDTGMPIKEIKVYAKMRAAGDETLPDRMRLLIQHRTKLVSSITKMQENLSQLDKKIQYYKEMSGKSVL